MQPVKWRVNGVNSCWITEQCFVKLALFLNVVSISSMISEIAATLMHNLRVDKCNLVSFSSYDRWHLHGPLDVLRWLSTCNSRSLSAPHSFNGTDMFVSVFIIYWKYCCQCPVLMTLQLSALNSASCHIIDHILYQSARASMSVWNASQLSRLSVLLYTLVSSISSVGNTGYVRLFMLPSTSLHGYKYSSTIMKCFSSEKRVLSQDTKWCSLHVVSFILFSNYHAMFCGQKCYRFKITDGTECILSSSVNIYRPFW